MLGVAQGALDHVIPYLKDRSQFGQKLWDFQVTFICLHSVKANEKKCFIEKGVYVDKV